MLWMAGQERIRRESRDRRAETWEAVRDAYVAGNVATGKAKWSEGPRLPAYVTLAAPKTTDPAERQRALARLGAMFPGSVTQTGRA